MKDEDKAYMSDVLALFKVTNFKLSETSSRFKLIIKPHEFDMKTLHKVQDLRDPVGIEVDISGVYLECLKSGSSRKRRRVCLEKFDGKIPKKYESGKFNGTMREILSIRDICEFDTSLEDGSSQ